MVVGYGAIVVLRGEKGERRDQKKKKKPKLNEVRNRVLSLMCGHKKMDS